MGDEREALMAEAKAHGDDLAAASRRFEMSTDIARALLGPGVDEDRVTLKDGLVWRFEVAGRLVVDEGVLCYGDLDTITKNANRAAEILWRRMAAL